MTGRRLSWRLVVVLLVLVFLAGSYQTTRTDGEGWCVHFNGWMVCNAAAATDYTYASR